MWTLYTEKASELEESGPRFLKSAVNFGLTKLDGYWKKLIDDPAVSYYCITTMLHPRLRQHWFEDKWSHFLT